MRLSQKTLLMQLHGMIADGGERAMNEVTFGEADIEDKEYVKDIKSKLKQLTPASYEKLLDDLTEVNCHSVVGNLTGLVRPGKKSRYR